MHKLNIAKSTAKRRQSIGNFNTNNINPTNMFLNKKASYDEFIKNNNFLSSHKSFEQPNSECFTTNKKNNFSTDKKNSTDNNYSLSIAKKLSSVFSKNIL